MKRRTSLIIIYLVALGSLCAQDAHYWTEQFGTRSMLLSNSIVGSVEDLGAVFYNPARLGIIENPAFVISAKVYELSNTTIENAVGENASLKKSRFGGAPSLVAGTFKVGFLPKHKFAYAFLTRRHGDVNVGTRKEVFGDVLEGIDGEEYFSGEFTIGKQYKDEWMGVSWSYPFNEHVSVGISTFGTIKNQDANVRTQLQVLSEAGDVDVYINKRNYGFTHYGILWKLGLALDYEKIKLGLTVTTPTVSVMGDGSFHYETLYSAVGEQNPIYEMNLQNGVKARYRTPYAIAFGTGIKLFKGSLHVSGEYYSKVNNYNIMQGEAFLGQSTGIQYVPDVHDQLIGVFNYGIGYSSGFSDKVTAYVSYSTDFSAAVGGHHNLTDNNVSYQASTFISNVNHIAGGIVLDLDRADITIGATNAFASYKVLRPIDFPDENDNGPIINPDDAYSTVDWSRWRFMLGVSVPFMEDVAKKWEKKLQGNGDKKDKKKNKMNDTKQEGK